MADKIVHGERRGTAGAGWAARCWPGRPGPRGLIPLVGLVGLVALVTLVTLLAGEGGDAVAPEIRPREVAAGGPSDQTVTEPDIAVAPNAAVAVFYTRGDGGRKLQIWHAAYNKLQQVWSSGVIDPDSEFTGLFDTSIAYDAHSGGFLAAAQGKDSEGKNHLLTCRFTYDDETGVVQPGVWESCDEGPGGMYDRDKPYLVAGDPTLPGGQEYYMVWWTGISRTYRYYRSVDGGRSWVFGDIEDADTGETVGGTSYAHPAVYQGGPLYVAYLTWEPPEPVSIRFLCGEDEGDGVRFRHLYAVPGPGDAPGDPLPLTVALNNWKVGQYLPETFSAKTVAQLAVDPSNVYRLYIVYHDTAAPYPDPGWTDANVYLRVLTSSGTVWSAGPRIKVNNDQTPYESDQFTPVVTVDAGGRIHIIFYDDRHYNEESDQEDGQTDPPPKFDVYYAYSTNQAAEWTNEKLFAIPPEPALDFGLDVEDLNPLEYNGIAWYGNEVWTVYTGTHDEDPPNDDAVMSSSLIDWTPQQP